MLDLIIDIDGEKEFFKVDSLPFRTNIGLCVIEIKEAAQQSGPLTCFRDGSPMADHGDICTNYQCSGPYREPREREDVLAEDEQAGRDLADEQNRRFDS